MSAAQQPTEHLLPLDLASQADSVSHSLEVLSTVYHYNHWIFDTIRNFLGPSIVEVGAGVGNITQFMLNASKLVCLEPFAPYHAYLKERMACHLNLGVHKLMIEDVPNADVPQGQADSVVCLNVLEHIPDDVAALKRMRLLLKPKGRVVVFVPAMRFLYGAMDKAMGHERRYTLGSLRAAFHAAGLKPVHGRYFNVVGLAGWYWNGRVRKRSTIPVSATLMFDRLVPYLSALERIFPPVVGQSVLVVGEA